MYLVEIVATLTIGRRITEDEICELVDTVVDDLDELSVEPSVGTRRVGDDVEFTVDVTVDEEDEFEALTSGLAAIKAAFHAAGVGTANFPVSRDLRSRVVAQPA
jgi:hypothetical protein